MFWNTHNRCGCVHQIMGMIHIIISLLYMQVCWWDGTLVYWAWQHWWRRVPTLSQTGCLKSLMRWHSTFMTLHPYRWGEGGGMRGGWRMREGGEWGRVGNEWGWGMREGGEWGKVVNEGGWGMREGGEWGKVGNEGRWGMMEGGEWERVGNEGEYKEEGRDKIWLILTTVEPL